MLSAAAPRPDVSCLAPLSAFLFSFLRNLLRSLPQHTDLGADDDMMPSVGAIIEAQEPVIATAMEALSLLPVLDPELQVQKVVAAFRTIETSGTANLRLKVRCKIPTR